MIDNVEKQFLQLLPLALWRGESHLPDSSAQFNWQEICNYAERHELLSVLFDVVEILPESQRPPFMAKLQWTTETLKQERIFEIYTVRFAKMLRAYAEHNIPVIPIKGLSLATYYPNPEHRNTGDIDLYIDEKYRQASQMLMKEIGAKGDDAELAIRHDTYKYDGLLWEIHMRTTVFSHNKIDRIYKSYEQKYTSAENLVDKEVSGIKFHTISPIFNIVYLTGHIMQHLLLEEVNLRQVCDWTMVLQKERELLSTNAREVEEMLDRLEMLKLFRALAYISYTYLNLKDYMPLLQNFSDKEKTNGEFLLRCVLDGQVPGCAPTEERILGEPYTKKARLFSELLKRCYKFYGICGHEAISTPLETIRKFIARRL